MKLTPPKGMNDFLPDEVDLRDYVQNTILQVYRSSGFRRIITPILEDAENLQKSDGGDNLNLIYQVMKRGAKFDQAHENSDKLWDMGLRYDLTLPLARYYALHKEMLQKPFKCIQIDRVYRAERPQKGRWREFVQCDIDIVGDDSRFAEIELIAVTAEALQRIGFENFTVKINDRRVLNALLKSFGFSPESIQSVSVSFDKMDKIGLEGVCTELSMKEMPADAVAAFREFFKHSVKSFDEIVKQIGMTDEIAQLQQMISELAQISDGSWNSELELSLVRGQGYYTGCVFEVKSPGYPGSIAGGGRYDNMIGSFLGTQVPAVGFSIGFERIISILTEKQKENQDTKKDLEPIDNSTHKKDPSKKSKLAYLYRAEGDFAETMKEAKELRGKYIVTTLEQSGKLGKQLKRLEKEGYSHVKCVGEAIRSLNQKV